MSVKERSHREHQNIKVQRAIVVSVQNPATPEESVKRSLLELNQLLEGLGYRVDAIITQKRSSSALPTYLGEGKLLEVAAYTGGTGIVARGPEARQLKDNNKGARTLVVADDELSPNQIRNLESALDADILDRTAVILTVFEKRAQTKELESTEFSFA